MVLFLFEILHGFICVLGHYVILLLFYSDWLCMLCMRLVDQGEEGRTASGLAESGQWAFKCKAETGVRQKRANRAGECANRRDHRLDNA